ncbi:MAG: phosphoenolpyruvate--protein phosphotransferase [Candidatus Delongbacteria bacterium]|nr:phosphoenolpyruvate--protein phosphotransferase [Candidatus Delongbacteria bacterium]
MMERSLSGIGASQGVAIGPARLIAERVLVVKPRTIPLKNIPAELERFARAIEQTAVAIKKIQLKANKLTATHQAEIFEVHLSLLQDPMLVDRTREYIRTQRINADYALLQALQEYQKLFNELGDETLQDRLVDVKDVGKRLIEFIQGYKRTNPFKFQTPGILLAHNLTPSDTIHLDRNKVLGVATELGGIGSHTAILTRALGIPAVVGVPRLLASCSENETIIVNGASGEVVLRPKQKTIHRYTLKQQAIARFEHSLRPLVDLPAQTRDGKRIHLLCNIELPEEAADVKAIGADGIGLFRTEYLFLSKNKLPSEMTQATEYLKAAKTLKPLPVTFRTFDLGGDKLPADLVVEREDNPFLGYRAIRVSLDKPRLFKAQLHAILRASIHGNVRLMFPMISTLQELLEAKELLEEAREELRKKKIPFDEQMPVGMMVETPAAVMLSDELARHVDFFSIGTNDLTQYALAADRGNLQVSHIYNQLDPSVLRLIALTVKNGHAAGIPVGLCGNLASDPLATILLIGLEVDDLSMAPSILPEIKNIIRSISWRGLRALGRQALRLNSYEEVRHFAAQLLEQWVEEIPY